MAIRFSGNFFDLNGAEYQVDIHDADFVGTATEIDVKYCNINYEGDQNDINAPMIGSRAEVSVVVNYEDATLSEFVDDFVESEESRFFLEITKLASSLVIWRGIITPDYTGETDTAPLYEFKIAAICGLATLKKVPYHDGSALYEGTERFTKHITMALGKLGHISMWGASDVFLKTAVDWWEASMSSGAADDALFQGGVEHTAFYNFSQPGDLDKDVYSCFDVIKFILDVFNCRIMQVDGVWWIEQIPYRTASPYYTRHYSKSGSYLTNATNSGANLINQTKTGAKVATVNYDFLPSFKKTDIYYFSRTRRNYLAFWSESFNSFNYEVDANGGEAVLHLKFTINYTIADAGTGAPGITGYFMFPAFKIKIGNRYLKRDYYVENFSAYVKDMEWTTTDTDRFHVPINVGVVPTDGTPIKGSVTVDVFTPPLPASGSTNNFSYLKFVMDVVDWFGDAASFDWFDKNVEAQVPYLEIFHDGTPFVQEDKVLFSSSNPDSASDRYEKNVYLSSANGNNGVGAILRWNGSAWVKAALWGQGVETRNKNLLSILSANIQNARLKPLRRMNGTLYGDFRMHRLIQTSDGKKWMLQAANWDIGRNTLNGSWFHLDYGTAGVSASPVKKKVNPPGTEPTIDPTPTTGGISTNNPGFNYNPPPTILKPVAFNATTAKIALGASVTSIAIEEATSGTEFLAGDGVTVVNPITGNFQTFEIQTAPGLGDTSLDVVTATADYEFPVGSYLVVKQNAYSFRLPQGTVEGQILRWDNISEEWEVYSGTTDGHVLTWDSTNGWQAEVSTGGGSNYQTLRDGGVDTTQRAAANFIDTGRVAFTLTDDGGNNETEITADIVANSIGNTELRQGLAASVIGRSAATGGNVADIASTANHQVLRRNDSGVIEWSLIGTDNIVDANITTAKIADLNVTTGKIADDAVTYAKIQNVANNNRVLGRVSGANGNVEELTAAQMQTLLGYIDGALTNPRIPYASDANTLTDSANLRWLDGTLEVMVGTGASLDARFAHRQGTITGDSKLMHGENNVSGTYDIRLVNTRNTANTGNSRLVLQTGGASAGDPFVLFVVASAGNDWAIGTDNTDSDKFKITPKATVPGSVANSGLIITSAATALVGINKDAPSHPLDVSGRARATEFINDFAAAQKPTVGTLGNGLGTGPTINDVSGSNNGFSILFTTGTAPVAGGDMFTVTFATEFPTISFPVFCQGNDNAANEFSKFSWSARSGANFTLKVRAGQTLTASTQYSLIFTCFGT